MRRWCVVVVVGALASARPVAAQPTDRVTARTDDVTPPPRFGYGAMPGGLHVAAAEVAPPGTIEVAALSGLGYRKGLLGADHTLERAIGELAIAYTPIDDLVVGLSIDGRYDQHAGLPAMTGEGYTGDPHLLARYAAPVGRISLGGQLGIWVPGKRGAPSLSPSAISVDARGVLSWTAGPVALAVDAGLRLDNSGKLAGDASALTVEHRVSLGASDFHAALVGAQLRVPLGAQLYAAVEGSAELFVGSGAPGPIVRAGGMLGVALGGAVAVAGYIDLARVPGIDGADAMAGRLPLIPYEPAVTAGLAIEARFGGARRRAPRTTDTAGATIARPVVVIAEVSGVVLDDAGKPIPGATITIRLKAHTGTGITDARGTYRITGLPIGRAVRDPAGSSGGAGGEVPRGSDDAVAELTVAAATRKPVTATRTLAPGRNVVPAITLDPLLPPGELRAQIINLKTSRPVAGAIVTIQPGDATAIAGADGKLAIELAPGHYQLTVTAPGFAPQQLDVTIEQNGVAIKNIELHR